MLIQATDSQTAAGEGNLQIMNRTLFRLLITVVGIIALVFGIYSTFFQTKGFIRTEAVIVSIEEEPGTAPDDVDDTEYTAIVTYTVDGTEYTQELDYFEPSFEVGKTIEVMYNPDDPADVHGTSKGFSIYMIVIGAVLTVFGALSLIIPGRRY